MCGALAVLFSPRIARIFANGNTAALLARRRVFKPKPDPAQRRKATGLDTKRDYANQNKKGLPLSGKAAKGASNTIRKDRWG